MMDSALVALWHLGKKMTKKDSGCVVTSVMNGFTLHATIFLQKTVNLCKQ